MTTAADRQPDLPPDLPPLGGSGGNPDLRELRLVLRALHQGWYVTPDLKRETIAKVASILRTSTRSREVLSAAKTLVGMSGVTLASLDVAMRGKQAEEFEQRIREIEEVLREHFPGEEATRRDRP
jgi:hypothetical protein